MDGTKPPHNTPSPNAQSLSTSLHSLPAPSDSFPAYSQNHKPYPRKDSMHPTDSPQVADSMTPEDARYLRKQAAKLATPDTSPGPLPVKSRRELQPQPETLNIVPDENPLNSPTHEQIARNVSHPAPNEHLPGQAIHVNQHITGGTWKYGLCDCGDIGVCCTGVWCPCIIYGKTQYRLSQRSERKDPTNMLGYSTFNGSCAAFAVLCGCNLILAAIQHSRLRKTYDIPGDVGTDFVRACCCCCCTLSQDEKEIKFRESQARRASTGPMQYMSPKGMDFSAPPNGILL